MANRAVLTRGIERLEHEQHGKAAVGEETMLRFTERLHLGPASSSFQSPFPLFSGFVGALRTSNEPSKGTSSEWRLASNMKHLGDDGNDEQRGSAANIP